MSVLILAGLANAASSEEAARRLDAAPAPLFTRIPPDECGVTMRHPLLPDHPRAYLYVSGFACGGVAIGDVNGDERPDVFFTSGPESNRLYLQTERPLAFRDGTAEAGVSGVRRQGDKPWSGGAAMADLNHDGYLDIYVCNYDAPNQLFINDGRGRFVERAAEWGLDIVDANLFPAFMDIDGSGELALYLLTNRYERPGGRPAKPPVVVDGGRPRISPEFEKYYALKQTGPSNYQVDFAGRPDRLLVIERDGAGRRRYRDASHSAGVDAEGGHGLSATWFDYNADGRPDLYVCNDFADADVLYRNEGQGPGGAVRFKNAIAEAAPLTTWSSMGADAADVNNDGLFDLAVGDMASRTHYDAMINSGNLADRIDTLLHSWPRQTMRNTLFLNTGAGCFLESAYLSGVAQTDWTWAIKLADFDNDGLVDMFVTNGTTRNYTDADLPFTTEMYIGHTDWDLLHDEPPRKERNLAFRNVDGLRFEDVSRAWGLDHLGMSYAAAYGDLDGDGDLDLVVSNLDEAPSIYRNNGAKNRHWTQIRLQGTASHPQGWGAIVRVKTAAGWQVRQMNPATGFLSCNDPLLHFGLGAHSEILALEVQWPSGRVQRVERLAADRALTLTEPSVDRSEKSDLPPTAATLFASADDLGFDFRHDETPYDDYRREPLLPGKLSQLGPGVAVGDADGDGRDDVYFGGARGQPGVLYLRREAARFTRVEGPWATDAACEDMGALWFDADGDGKLDLYVVSGGVEAFEDDKVLQDRLYLNRTPPTGPVRFYKAPGDALPVERRAGSVACAADFDGDGDLDLFVGSRSIPGRYPYTPRSALLRNDSAPGRPKFLDVTDEAAPGLANAGLVTGAIWSDVDADGRPDLLVVSEWGPVKCFHNQRGKLVDQTRAAGVAGRTGWWNGVSAGDFDDDGRIDYVVANVGLNTKYGAPSPNRPTVLYAGDLVRGGGFQIVEAKVGPDGELPVRGLASVSRAIPLLQHKFATHRAYASALLPDIYDAEAIRQSTRLVASEFRSGMLFNRSTPGRPKFEWKALPDIVQISPSYGAAVADFDGDGRTDAVLAQNNFTREPETGLWRGGVGQLLHGDSVDGLQAVPARESGIVVRGDAKGAAVLDLDADSRPDLLVSLNDDAATALRNQSGNGWASLRLIGPSGAPAIGARVTTRFADGRISAHELIAGSGYLSQSSPEIFLGLGGAPPVSAEILWPSGKVQHVDLRGKSGRITLNQ